MFLASILPWVKFEGFDGDVGWSAWTSQFGLFPVATFIPLAGLVTAGIVAARLFAKDKVPSNIAGFSLLQIQQVLAVFTLLLALGYLITDKQGASAGFGFWLNLLGAIGLVVAAVLEVTSANKPATSFGGGGQPGYGGPPQPSYPPPGTQQQQYPQQPQQGQPYPPQQQQPRPQQQPQQQPPRQQPPAGQGYPPPPPQQGGNWPQQ